MRNSKVAVASHLVVWCLAIGWIGAIGCTDSKPRQAGKNLLEATQKAQRLYGRALGLMSGPSIVDTSTGQMSPITPVPASIEKVEMLQPSALNPNALKALEEAEKLLSEALEDAAEAPERDKGMAAWLLGQVVALKGQYQAARAAGAGDRAGEALDQAEGTLAVLRSTAGLGKYYQAMLALSNDDVNKMISQAKADQAGITAGLRENSEAVSAQEKAMAGLASENDKLLAEARDLRDKSNLAGGEKGLELLRQALAKEEKVARNASAIGKAEETVSLLKARRALLEVDLAAVKDRLAAGDKVLAARQQGHADSSARFDELKKAMAESLADLNKLAVKINDAAKEAGQAVAEAIDAFDRAGKHLALAKDDLVEREIAAGEGEVLLAMAKASERNLRLLERIAAFAGQVARVFAAAGIDAPAGLKAMSPQPAEIDQLRDDAARSYEKAADIYQQAARQAPENIRWAYQGRLAVAYQGAGEVRRDSAKLRLAKEVLQEATQNREASPHLRSMVMMRYRLEAQP